MHYRSISDLSRDLGRMATRLPRSVTVVAGVPRSGMLAASILALQQNLALTDVEGLAAGRLFAAGSRKTSEASAGLLSTPAHVLVIDDSVNTGEELRRIRKRLEAVSASHRIEYAAAYVSPAAKHSVDYYADLVEPPRVFEWNLFHHPVLRTSCMDIDGVLCHDPSDEENDDGSRYEEFLRTARPYRIPSVRVGWLVTSRLEKYRAQTEAWLQANGVEYDSLEMLDLPSAEARRESQSHGRFKAEVYRRTGADLFIESCPDQASEIARETGSPVFCVSIGEMVDGIQSRVTSRAARIEEEVGKALTAVSPGGGFILLDDDQPAKIEPQHGRRRFPFVEHEGAHWGQPENSEVAIRELERMRTSGVEAIAVTQSAFWWLDYYCDFNAHLNSRYTTLVRSPWLIAFDLRRQRN